MVHYTSSEISFDAGPSAAATTTSTSEKLDLPAGATLRVKIGTPIDSEQSRVGDKIEGRLERAVKEGARTFVPKRAIVTGRIRRLERVRKPAHHVLGLEITKVRFENRVARIRATLRRVSGLPGGESLEGPAINPTTGEIVRSPPRRKQRPILTDRNLPGVGMFRIHGRKFRIRPGLKTVWRVEAAD